MSRIFYYKLVVDNGGAPCIEDGLFSLAICKPGIRKSARTGDTVFGFAANSLHRDNRLIYVAQITAVKRNGCYYKEPAYSDRADSIYRSVGLQYEWREDAKYHGPESITRDLGEPSHYDRAHVLLSDDFRYFGADGSADYRRKYPRIGHAVEALGVGYRVNLAPILREEFEELRRELWSTPDFPVVQKKTDDGRCS